MTFRSGLHILLCDGNCKLCYFHSLDYGKCYRKEILTDCFIRLNVSLFGCTNQMWQYLPLPVCHLPVHFPCCLIFELPCEDLEILLSNPTALSWLPTYSQSSSYRVEFSVEGQVVDTSLPLGWKISLLLQISTAFSLFIPPHQTLFPRHFYWVEKTHLTLAL